MPFNIDSANVEKIKEILRWLILFLISWFITSTLGQANLVPETFDLKIWVFVYTIPVRVLFVTVLTVASRALDRLLHENNIKTPLTLKSLDTLKK